MDNVPSKSISKSVLIATPLFIFILAVLNSISELSYLFVLDFASNVGGSADIMFLPTTKPEVPQGTFEELGLRRQFGINSNNVRGASPFGQLIMVPLVRIKDIQEWVDSNSDVIRGASPRWIIPGKSDRISTIIMALNITQEKEIGIIPDDTMPQINKGHAAVEQSLMQLLGLEVGDVLTVRLEPKNFLTGLKMFNKYQEHSSKAENTKAPEFDPAALADYAYDQFRVSAYGITRQEFATLVELSYNQGVTGQYTVQYGFNSDGLYPSNLHNVVIISMPDLEILLSRWVVQLMLSINNQYPKVINQIPAPYNLLWPSNEGQAKTRSALILKSVSKQMSVYSLYMVCTVRDRQEVYSPEKGQSYTAFLESLESIPGSTEPFVLYPFYKVSLSIKYFFDSILQIFKFVSCILYFYTMTLIMKQIYQEKEIEVGIWRTLGAGAVSRKINQPLEVQMAGIRNEGTGLSYHTNFHTDLTCKERLVFYFRLMAKVGFIKYWTITALASLVLYAVIQVIMYKSVASVLSFRAVSQPIAPPFVIVGLTFAFIQVLCVQNIRRIFTEPLSETIKPMKRTFDLVKVKVIHIATFGISLEILLLSLMLIYYGVVSYYWIPFAALDRDQNLQVLLLNSIFVLMILGAIMLLGIFQSRLERLIFMLLFRVLRPMKCMKLVILKNIKAKQYKNLKVAVIVSLIFAFLLFFTTGTNIQIQIIQSFVERSLGADLVFEDYEEPKVDARPVSQFLDKKGLNYCWLSRSLSFDDLEFRLISHVSKDRATPQFQVLSPDYLNATFFEYYYPEQYLPESKSYWKLPNSLPNGFSSIYTGENGEESVGKYDPGETLNQSDPYSININKSEQSPLERPPQMPPREQIIEIVASTSLRKRLKVKVGSIYKMEVINTTSFVSFFMRARIVHSFKQGPGFDILRQQAFVSLQQAEYIYEVLGVEPEMASQNEKLMIKGSQSDLKGVANTITGMSPEETLVFSIDFVSRSFRLFEKYLTLLIIFVTAIMSGLLVLFLFLYTIGKCQEEAEMYKMLRAVGLSVTRIRIMVFAEILIRLLVSIIDGILLGLILSIGFSFQVEEFLMLKTPQIDMTVIMLIALVLLIVFAMTVIGSTAYIANRTVSQTNKHL